MVSWSQEFFGRVLIILLYVVSNKKKKPKKLIYFSQQAPRLDVQSIEFISGFNIYNSFFLVPQSFFSPSNYITSLTSERDLKSAPTY